MKIHSMTATFGKLEGAVLTLKPGMNRIYAPNEWGKSTWCAFLMDMFYGIDTRAKSTRGSLADKDHYAPWSGSPMSGCIELEWRGRNITIERETRGRVPMGYFRAYETETGLDVPELTAENCGQLLLGVERSVYRRASFVRLPDLPVSEDEALRRRLNALVTTGDESGDGFRLEQSLKELKNRCRYNRSGLLPQAEQERDGLRRQLSTLEGLNAQLETLTRLAEENRQTRRKLQNHLAALDYASAQQDAKRVAQAEEAYLAAQKRLERQEAICAQLPDWEEAQEQLETLEAYQLSVRQKTSEQLANLHPPENPSIPRVFLGMEPETAMEQAQEDARRLKALSGPVWWILLLLSGVMLAAGFMLLYAGLPVLGMLGSVLCLMLLVLGIVCRQRQEKGVDALRRKYGSPDPGKWLRMAQDYEAAMENYQREWYAYRAKQEKWVAQAEKVNQQKPDAGKQLWEKAVQAHRELEDARAAVRRAWEILEPLRARPVPEAAEDDDMTETREQTLLLLQQAEQSQQRLLARLGEVRGQMTAMDSETALRQKLSRLEERMAELEQTYAALQLAQQTLNRATVELQRRFAPRIAKRTQAFMAGMTGGRYDRIRLGEDLSLKAGAAGENTLRDVQWRSEGTVDQLYLSLRLAVAEELTPEAPLVLDDALVRFDEERLAAVLDILEEIAGERQVIVFSCQQRAAG